MRKEGCGGDETAGAGAYDGDVFQRKVGGHSGRDGRVWDEV